MEAGHSQGVTQVAFWSRPILNCNESVGVGMGVKCTYAGSLGHHLASKAHETSSPSFLANMSIVAKKHELSAYRARPSAVRSLFFLGTGSSFAATSCSAHSCSYESSDRLSLSRHDMIHPHSAPCGGSCIYADVRAASFCPDAGSNSAATSWMWHCKYAGNPWLSASELDT